MATLVDPLLRWTTRPSTPTVPGQPRRRFGRLLKNQTCVEWAPQEIGPRDPPNRKEGGRERTVNAHPGVKVMTRSVCGVGTEAYA